MARRTGYGGLTRLPDIGLTVCVARQRIQDASGRLVGHEALFRPSRTAEVSGEGGADFDDDLATATVISVVTTEFALDEIGGQDLLFVNLPRSFVVGELPVSLTPGKVVLELLERVPVDDEVRAGLERLVARGFTIALDDVLPGDPRLTYTDLCGYVKIDLSAVTGPALTRLVEQVRERAPHVQLVAEHIETPADRDLAVGLGFDLFQGYLLSRPAVMARESLAHHNPTASTLLHKLSVPSSSTRSLARLASADPAIAARLLRSVNNVTGVRLPVTDLVRAIALVGRQRFHSILVLDMVAELGHDDDELPLLAVARSRAAQLLCPDDPLLAATAAVVRLWSQLLDLTPEQADRWLGVPPPPVRVRAMCDALDAYLEAADRGEPVDLGDDFSPLAVSVAWLTGLREGRELIGQVALKGRRTRR
ncbi:EAL and HDOD domain-containing protein [Cellulomonas citrea]|uniref:EAL and HDOD domain-containing protein n=1 Tax=Cellulomonas citrea TaxID=1909423 RepID=UPI00135A30F5|nr:EAL domain-containing protein [Cellulomonas citrea]